MRWLLLVATSALGQDFSGDWKLDANRSDSFGQPPAETLKITMASGKISCAGCGSGSWQFTTDTKSNVATAGGVRNSIAAKWEGSALLVNTLVVEGSRQYTVMDRWQLSRDNNTLNIKRELQRGGSSSEARFVYRRAGTEAEPAPAPAPDPQPVSQPAPQPEVPRRAGPMRVERAVPVRAQDPPKAADLSKEYTIEAETRLAVRSLSSISTRSAKEGDRVYLETVSVVARDGRIVIPRGSQVTARVAFAKGAGRVKGRGELVLRFESIVLPNGVTKDATSHLGSADPSGGSVDREGNLRSHGSKGQDAGTVATTTATGTAVGGVIGAATGHTGMGAGIGAAAGAAAGLGKVFGSKGHEATIRQGDVVEMVLDRELRFSELELAR